MFSVVLSAFMFLRGFYMLWNTLRSEVDDGHIWFSTSTIYMPTAAKVSSCFFTDLNNIYIYTYRYIYFVELLLSARIRYFWLPQELPSHFWFFQPKTLHHLADDCTRTPSIWNLWCSKAFIRNLFDSLCSSWVFFFFF